MIKFVYLLLLFILLITIMSGSMDTDHQDNEMEVDETKDDIKDETKDETKDDSKVNVDNNTPNPPNPLANAIVPWVDVAANRAAWELDRNSPLTLGYPDDGWYKSDWGLRERLFIVLTEGPGIPNHIGGNGTATGLIWNELSVMIEKYAQENSTYIKASRAILGRDEGRETSADFWFINRDVHGMLYIPFDIPCLCYK